MTDGAILDGLLLIAILLYVPIGALRGGLREAILGGAILLGGLLAATRPASWAEWTASSADVSPDQASFLVAAACLGATALLLGIGGAALCDRRMPTWRGRILGAGLGGMNATVLIAFLLIGHEDLARAGERSSTIARSQLAEALIDRVDLLLLSVAVLAGVATAGAHLTHRLFGVPYDTELEPALTWLQGTQRPARPIRIPAEADGGKVEPDAPIFGTGAFEPVIRSTRAVRPVAPPGRDQRDGWSEHLWGDEDGFDHTGPQPTRGHRAEPAERRRDDAPSRGAYAPDGGRAYDAGLAELHRLLRIAPPSEERDPPSPVSRIDLAPRSKEGLGGGPVEPERCPHCETLLPDPTLPCPFCDHRS